jgi:hypothetical protein
VLPRISGLNFGLLSCCDTRKRFTISSNNEHSELKLEDKEKENFFNTLAYKKLREMEKVLEEGAGEPGTRELEDLMVGMAGQPTDFSIRKIFKNFGIQDYFDNFIHDRKVYNLLLQIQDS